MVTGNGIETSLRAARFVPVIAGPARRLLWCGGRQQVGDHGLAARSIHRCRV
jgi:hypothetical protein